MYNWSLPLLAFLAVLHPIASFTDRNLVDGRQQCCDHQTSRDTRYPVNDYRLKLLPEDRLNFRSESRHVGLIERREKYTLSRRQANDEPSRGNRRHVSSSEELRVVSPRTEVRRVRDFAKELNNREGRVNIGQNRAAHRTLDETVRIREDLSRREADIRDERRSQQDTRIRMPNTDEEVQRARITGEVRNDYRAMNNAARTERLARMDHQRDSPAPPIERRVAEYGSTVRDERSFEYRATETVRQNGRSESQVDNKDERLMVRDERRLREKAAQRKYDSRQSNINTRDRQIERSPERIREIRIQNSVEYYKENRESYRNEQRVSREQNNEKFAAASSMTSRLSIIDRARSTKNLPNERREEVQIRDQSRKTNRFNPMENVSRILEERVSSQRNVLEQGNRRDQRNFRLSRSQISKRDNIRFQRQEGRTPAHERSWSASDMRRNNDNQYRMTVNDRTSENRQIKRQSRQITQDNKPDLRNSANENKEKYERRATNVKATSFRSENSYTRENHFAIRSVERVGNQRLSTKHESRNSDEGLQRQGTILTERRLSQNDITRQRKISETDRRIAFDARSVENTRHQTRDITQEQRSNERRENQRTGLSQRRMARDEMKFTPERDINEMNRRRDIIINSERRIVRTFRDVTPERVLDEHRQSRRTVSIERRLANIEITPRIMDDMTRRREIREPERRIAFNMGSLSFGDRRSRDVTHERRISDRRSQSRRDVFTDRRLLIRGRSVPMSERNTNEINRNSLVRDYDSDYATREFRARDMLELSRVSRIMSHDHFTLTNIRATNDIREEVNKERREIDSRIRSHTELTRKNVASISLKDANEENQYYTLQYLIYTIQAIYISSILVPLFMDNNGPNKKSLSWNCWAPMQHLIKVD